MNQSPLLMVYSLWTVASFCINAAASNGRSQRRPLPHLHALNHADAAEEHSFAKRHNLPIPPIISRKTRRKRRAQASNQTESEQTDVDSVTADAKSGEDPNARLRTDLVWGTFYDRNSYPWEYAWQGDAEGNETGLPVEMDINFHRVYSVDVVNPTLDLIVWFRLEWVDPRLTWDPKEYGNHTKTWFWINGNAGGETSEIWTPDIELWNLLDGLADSLEDAYAVVSYDGSVYWSRPGHLRPACKYRGLERFPFDKLECTIELGSWSYSGMYLTLVKGGSENAGFHIGGSETAGESHNEFTLIEENPVSCEVFVYSTQIWDIDNEESRVLPDSVWPVLLYNVTLERAWQPYARGYIFSQILLIFIGFSAFWLPPACGERMGLSITAMLASIASDIVIAGNLPQAKTVTWFQKFSIMNAIFVFLALIESVVVLYFHYARSDSMVPKWYTYIQQWKAVSRAQKRGSDLMNGATDSVRRTAGSIRESVLAKRRSNENGNSNGGCPADSAEEEEEENDFVADELPFRRPRAKERSNRLEASVFRDSLVRDADDFLNEDELMNNLKWREYAVLVDDISRFWFPLLYSISASIILARAKS